MEIDISILEMEKKKIIERRFVDGSPTVCDYSGKQTRKLVK